MNTSELTIHQKLNLVQTSLKVEKGHKNNFGNYDYRNLADIFEAIKPLLDEYLCWVTVSDEMIHVGGSNYIKATATFGDEHGNTVEAMGYARESVSKKGMDDSQITGATSSYARKYACNGLFAIDDTKDADSMDNRKHISELRKNTKGKVIQLSDDGLKLKRLSLSKEFAGTEVEKKISEWLQTEPSDEQIIAQYAQLKDKQEGIKQKAKKESK